MLEKSNKCKKFYWGPLLLHFNERSGQLQQIPPFKTWTIKRSTCLISHTKAQFSTPFNSNLIFKLWLDTLWSFISFEKENCLDIFIYLKDNKNYFQYVSDGYEIFFSILKINLLSIISIKKNQPSITDFIMTNHRMARISRMSHLLPNLRYFMSHSSM